MIDFDNNTSITLSSNESFPVETVSPEEVPTDRKTVGKYSQEEFRSLPINVQLELCTKYLIETPADSYDADNMFQFSRTTLKNMCEHDLGFKKVYIATDASSGSDGSPDGDVLYIDFEQRETVARKYNLSKDTADLLDQLLTDRSGRSIGNQAKSRIVDALLQKVIKEKLDLKTAGKFSVVIKPSEPRRLL
ncbi:hypothetical protein CXIVA_07760 [Clostridium sp. SY8519]|uniref:hypothetical protein n=1 Tax=Clostridium sp. (strain SY8519) TaxID=1042156 RepID=UPI0002172024|nr:hypothetical protein [Clostridium sp. SY8519]BAK46743.1 hypothetical protein CXIVA_07760 [Clostridium sp. SY8519]